MNKEDERVMPQQYPTQSQIQDKLLLCMEISSTKISPQKLVSRKVLLQLWCEFVETVMDINGNLLEYRHLMKRPKYKDKWGIQYGIEVRLLAQGMPDWVDGTDTIFFVKKMDISVDCLKDATYVRVVCNVWPHK